ncbi:hypothetical protein quinque_002316 [Culex quinquefasciatus]
MSELVSTTLSQKVTTDPAIGQSRSTSCAGRASCSPGTVEFTGACEANIPQNRQHLLLEKIDLELAADLRTSYSAESSFAVTTFLCGVVVQENAQNLL